MASNKVNYRNQINETSNYKFLKNNHYLAAQRVSGTEFNKLLILHKEKPTKEFFERPNCSLKSTTLWLVNSAKKFSKAALLLKLVDL